MSGLFTRVAIVFIPQRLNVHLRFGRPAHERIIDSRRRVAEFDPEAVFCRIRWQGNEYGTTLWQFSILQAAPRGESFQRIAGVVPGATLLCMPTIGPRMVIATVVAGDAQCAGRGYKARSTHAPQAGCGPSASLLGVTALVAAAYLKPAARLVYNPTESAPRGWYVFVPMIRAQPGDYVVALQPSDTAALAATRGYLPRSVAILKQIAAVAGQRVCIRDAVVYIDGNVVARTLDTDAKERPLIARTHCRHLISDELFLLNPRNRASFDAATLVHSMRRLCAVAQSRLRRRTVSDHAGLRKFRRHDCRTGGKRIARSHVQGRCRRHNGAQDRKRRERLRAR
jgi:type IV secretory pathway protease TraF